MDIEVKGHSGCSIDIVREGKELFILKGTCDPKYVERLYQQALKQQRAGEQEYQYIRVPQIVDIERQTDTMMMKMEYVYSHILKARNRAINYDRCTTLNDYREV